MGLGATPLCAAIQSTCCAYKSAYLSGARLIFSDLTDYLGLCGSLRSTPITGDGNECSKRSDSQQQNGFYEWLS